MLVIHKNASLFLFMLYEKGRECQTIIPDYALQMPEKKIFSE
ncbi:hypothetical protein DBT_1746 [Dissulfuribacter thermophilus]|uniref:Uncharacterized protein n=1 Tax=Dissulfuribacter thermophilus TaxID=1156395 RepID=A0A1B9F5A7_9BACT|nr:hypothetical protein DBT_1746 [Dissulfuribacter thermophilus]